MLNTLFLGSLLLLPTLGQAASIVPRQQDVCGPQPNLLVNPSWELGTIGWTYSNNVSPQIASGVSSDGAQSLSISPSVYSTWSVRQSAGGGTLDRSKSYTFSVDIAAAAYPPYAGPLICTLQAYHCQTYNYIFDKTVAFAPSSTPSAFATYSGSFIPPNLVEDIVITGYCRYSTQSSTPTPGPFTLFIDNAKFSMDAPTCPTSTPVSTVPSTTSPVSTPEPTTPSATSTVLSTTTTPADSTTIASTTPSDSMTPSVSATPSATDTVSSTPTPSDTTTPTPTTLATITTPSSTVPSGTVTSQPESLTPTSSSATPVPTSSRPCRRRNRRTATVI
ncbi:hypothetical protein V2G26_011152 [Clonostachys chloroleuca]